ncbi:hypothetical protein [Phenylobacterium aquaticum]|uniref:hypothetical protein n=1 Tax=Phenylobacterium aquaticum TaxID=1763816 RepID=UPI001F5C95C1|nr:hypothetical protein [Phenylobacterium aquaticum]MCI3135453.1 hypothetical protein [Phenylobacterium aquaticum]
MTADARQIVADYQRKLTFRTVTWKVEVNRMTGPVRVASPDHIGFAGACAPESNQPKF